MERIRTSEATGGKGEEAGFVIPRVGNMGKMTYQPNQEDNKAGMRQDIPLDALGALHTHDKYHVATPSPADQAAARASKKTIYVEGRNGLYSVDPMGQIMQAFQSPTWATDKNPK
jgi:hypothetical protein